MHIEEAMKQYEFLTGRKLKNSTKINLFIHVGCLTERLIRNSAIEDYPEKDKFQKIHKKEIRQIQAAFSVIEKTYSVKIPISEIGYIYDILAGI
jgi:sigma-54 dependent transcriptional regulator of gfr operon